MKKIFFLLITSITFYGCGSTLATFFPTVTVSVTALNFEATAGGDDPAIQQITVDCTYNETSLLDPQDCELNLTTEQTWIDVYPATTIGQENVEVTANITGLEPGTYQGNIHVESEFPNATDDEQDITVNLTVNPASQLHWAQNGSRIGRLIRKFILMLQMFGSPEVFVRKTDS